MKNNATTEETNLINNLKKRKKKKEKLEITCKVASNCIKGNLK